MTIAWKVLTAPQMAALLADGRFAGAPVDLADGYIHLSTADQLPETLEKHFAGQSDLHLAEADLTLLGDAVRWEPSRGGALFPHVYGELPLSAVVAHGPLERGADGAILLPVPPPTGEGDHAQHGGGARGVRHGRCPSTTFGGPPPRSGEDLGTSAP